MALITKDEDVLFRLGDVVQCSDTVERTVSFISLAAVGAFPIVWTENLPWNAGCLTLLRRPVQLGDLVRSDVFGYTATVHAHAKIAEIKPPNFCHADGTEIEWRGVLDRSEAKVTLNPPPPMNCTRCNHRNEYLGWEHVSANGSYTCGSCK